MAVDDRIELRITSHDKNALMQRAQCEGVSLSKLLRRSIRAILGHPVQLRGESALEVLALRRRVNAILARLDELGRTEPEVRAIRRDLVQLHADAQSLLGRVEC